MGRQHGHLQTLHVVGVPGIEGLPFLLRLFLHALFDQVACHRVHDQFHAGCGRCGLAGMVVGGGADAAATHDHIAAGQHLLQQTHQARPVVAQHVHIGQCQPALGKQFDHFGNVPVAATARQQFIAHHDQPEGGQSCVYKRGCNALRCVRMRNV